MNLGTFLKVACYTPVLRKNAKYSICHRIVLNHWYFCSELIDFDDETGLRWAKIWLLWNSYLKIPNTRSRPCRLILQSSLGKWQELIFQVPVIHGLNGKRLMNLSKNDIAIYHDVSWYISIDHVYSTRRITYKYIMIDRLYYCTEGNWYIYHFGSFFAINWCLNMTTLVLNWYY